MTAIVIEGVSLQDLESLREAKCCADDNPAVTLVSHPGCTRPSMYCTAHTELLRKQTAYLPPEHLLHHICGATFELAELTTRPI